jgi:hypothetical protein
MIQHRLASNLTNHLDLPTATMKDWIKLDCSIQSPQIWNFRYGYVLRTMATKHGKYGQNVAPLQYVY